MNVARFISLVVLLAGWLLTPHPAQGQLTRLGEFKLNKTTQGNQLAPRIASDASDNTIVVWTGTGGIADGQDVFAQRYNSAGSPIGATEFRVNTATSANQADAIVACAPDGRFVVVWYSDGSGAEIGLFFRRYAADGTPLDTPQVRVPTSAGVQRFPDVCMDDSGNFVIVWANDGRQGDGAVIHNIYAQRYSSDGTPVGGEISVNQAPFAGDQTNPSVDCAGDGRFVIVWRDDSNPNGAGYDALGRIYAANGTPAGNPFFLHTNKVGGQFSSVVAMADDATFVVAWDSDTVDGNGLGVAARRFSSAGVGGSEIQVNTATNGNQFVSSIAIQPTKDFIVLFKSAGFDGNGNGVAGRRFGVDDSPIDTNEFRVNTFTVGEQAATSRRSVIFDSQGNIFCVWSSDNQDGDLFGNYADKFYLPNQGPPLSEFRVNTTTTGDQSGPAVAMNQKGDAVVVWLGSRPVTGQVAIVAQKFNPLGLRVGPQFIVNDEVPAGQPLPALPSVAMSDDGAFVVAWTAYDVDGTTGIRARQFPPAAAPGDEFQVNTFVNAAQEYPAVAAAPNGDFQIAWVSLVANGNGTYEIIQKRYNKDGSVYNQEGPINELIAGNQLFPSISMVSNENFLIAWQSGGSGERDGSGFGISAKIFNGLPLVEKIVNSTTIYDQSSPSAAINLATGDFVVVWQSNLQDGNGTGIYGQRYLANGDAFGGQFQINVQTAGDQKIPHVAFGAGYFVVTWCSPQDGNGYGVYSRRFDFQTLASGGEIRVNQFTQGNQDFADNGAADSGGCRKIAMDAAGNYMIVWHSENQDGSGYGVYATKVFVPTLPKVVSAAATNPTGDGITLTGVVNPGSAATQVRFEYGPTSNLGSMTQSQTIGDGHEDVPVSVPVTGLTPGSSYFFQLVAMNTQGPAVRGALLTFSTALVGPTQGPLTAVAAARSFQLQTNGLEWRVQGEGGWNVDGAILNLVPGEYVFEFRKKPGEAGSSPTDPVPRPLTLTIEAGSDVQTESSDAFQSTGTGSLVVSIEGETAADPIATQGGSQRGQWRFAGEVAWRNGGLAQLPLAAGTYRIEFKSVAGRVPLAERTVLIEAGKTVQVRAIYFRTLAQSASAAQPQKLPLATATTQAPFCFAGQFRSDAGFSSGMVVREKVVLTAGHVVFDDATLTFAAGLQWRFQRVAGEFEPVPLTPRGSYLFSSYSALRGAARAANETGEARQASQQRDVAAVFFKLPAGRGGFSGFLTTTGSAAWLEDSRLKTLVCYPVDPGFLVAANGLAASDAGKMFRTPPRNATFTKIVPTELPEGVTEDGRSGADKNRVYATTDIAGYAGSSGGAVCVAFDDGNFYPAAVYLGGDGRFIARAIDADVANLVAQAEDSATTDDNHTGGGIVQVESRLSAAGFALAKVVVDLGPDAELAGPDANGRGGWRLATESPGTYHGDGATVLLSSGEYTVSFKPVPGLGTPPPFTFKIEPTETVTLAAIYSAPRAPLITTSALNPAIRGDEDYLSQVKVSGAVDSFSAPALTALGLRIDAKTGKITVDPAKQAVWAAVIPDDYPVEVTAGNKGKMSRRTVRLSINEPGFLKLTWDGGKGRVALLNSNQPTDKGLIKLPQTVRVVLEATPIGQENIFKQWRGNGIAGLPTAQRKLDFVMGPDVQLEAEFVENPFPAVAGQYRGMMSGVTASFYERGVAEFAVSAKGAFSGKLQVSGESFSVRDTLQTDGSYDKTLKTGAILRQLSLRLNLSTRLLDGRLELPPVSLTGPRRVLTFTAEPRAFLAGQTAPATLASRFSAVLPPDASQPGAAFPQGTSVIAWSTSPFGDVKATLLLADGAKTSAGGYLTRATAGAAPSWVLYSSGYRNRGVVIGALTFPATGTPHVGGPVEWYRLPRAPGAVFALADWPGGGATPGLVSTLQGYRYEGPHTASNTQDGKSVLDSIPFPPSPSPFFTLTAGTTGSQLFQLTALGKLTLAPPATLVQMKVSLDPKTGIFTGSFLDGANGKQAFQGVLLQVPGNGEGAGAVVSSQTSAELTLAP